MDWIQTRRRGPEWKQGWTDQNLSSSISAPPLPLIAVFAIVIFLLSLSQYSTYKEQMRYSFISFKIFLFFVPVLLVFSMRSGLFAGGGGWWFGWRSSSQNGQKGRPGLARGMPGFPWGVAVLLVALLVLVSYQSSFHSKWSLIGSD